MTVAVFPGQDYAADMQRVADEMRRNTHLVVASGPFGETRCEHARPHAHAVEYAAEWARTLGDAWTVKAVPVRKVLR